MKISEHQLRQLIRTELQEVAPKILQIGPPTMKITKQQLHQIIREEVSSLTERDRPRDKERTISDVTRKIMRGE